MQYSAAVALLIGSAAAGTINVSSQSNVNADQPFFHHSQEFQNPQDGELFDYQQRNSFNDHEGRNELLRADQDSFVGDLLNNQRTHNDRIFGNSGDSAGYFLDDGLRRNEALCADGSTTRFNRDYFTENNAVDVDGSYVSCHTSERIIPAVREQTDVKSAACFKSDAAAQYSLCGEASNEYTLSGNLYEDEDVSQSGTKTVETSLDLCGSKNKSFSQSGNKALDCRRHIGLGDVALDQSALEVTASPEDTVNDQVNAAIEKAINNVLSQAITHCLSEALKNSVEV